MRRLWRLLLAIPLVLGFPFLHLFLTVLIGVATHQSRYAIVVGWINTVFEFVFAPYALLNGHYPTINVSLFEYGFVAIYVVAGCSIFSLLLVWLWKRFIYPRRNARILFYLSPLMLIVLAFAWQIGHPPKITVDVAEKLGEFPAHHRGFSQGGEGQMKEAGYFENAMTILEEISPRIIRIDHLYDYFNVLSYDDEGTAVYDWTELDRIVNAILDAGAEPLMSLSYTPPVLADKGVYAPPNDLQAWEELVYETVRYYNIERDLGIRYWEVWNEPNLEGFWNGTVAQYMELYGASARGIKQADPSALVGGMAISSMDTLIFALHSHNEKVWYDELITYLQANDLPMDFVSWHLYTPVPENFRNNIATVQSWISELDPQPELHMTEWNYSGGGSHALDTGETAAYIAQTLAVFVDSELDQAYYFEPIDGHSNWSNRWGLIREDGLRKASFYVFALFDTLSGERLSVQSNHPDIGGLATENADGTIRVLVWNNTESAESVAIELQNLPENSQYELRGVDQQHGNPYDDESATDTLISEFQPLDNHPLVLDIPARAVRLITLES